ncbi:hypothetical protein PIB30_053187 [Stylosanthes scabra]|uniref:Uncharacterized protein n=1 Tax=Stylosanthes scabra TaxID=79078 RepID=A0ABU6XGM2_9FABA|nr:hypothetical protein [Stylosanthes scabra]
MGSQDSTFGVRRCAFGDKPYGVAESYSREGVDVEGLARNISPTRELRAFWAKLVSYEPSFDVFRVVLSTSGCLMYVKRTPSTNVLAATCPFEVQALRGDVSFFLADVAEGNNDFSRGVWFSKISAYLFFEMAKKKSCQNVRNPRVLSPVERELYGWVDAEVFTQSSVLASEHLPELRREMKLT